jgi:hypothetical protein
MITAREAADRLDYLIITCRKLSVEIHGVDDVIELVQEQEREIELMERMIKLACTGKSCDCCNAFANCLASPLQPSKCVDEYRKWLEREAEK